MNEPVIPMAADSARGVSDSTYAGAIDDNSKRGISVRINTSDYGRIKMIARRLRVREPEVIRYVIKAGLADISPLTNATSTKWELLAMFAAHGSSLVDYLKLNVRRLDQLLNSSDIPSSERIVEEDLELIAMSNLPGYMLAPRLRDLTGHAVQPEEALTTLYQYLLQKYPQIKTAEGVAR